MVRSIPALISLALFSTFLNAQPAPAASAAAAAAAAADDAASCIEVEVNGEKTPSFACLTQKLRPAADARNASLPPPALGSEAIILRPSNQLGLFNRAATSNRMGNTFGTSVYPQRPPPQVPATPLIPNARP
ncbi:hypothetical protein [Polaromonas sp. YR568]|uniref:hypothetical protein n=1 Tax=Polaromonas sp. YR568 TaxID=1855301 RepID=UPI00398BFB8C